MKINLLCTDPKRGGRISAGIIDNGVFKRKVSVNKHIIRKYKAFGIQKEICELMKRDFVKEIYFISPSVTWAINVDEFFKNAFEEDLGHGPQLIIQLRHMKEKSNVQIKFPDANKLAQK